MNRPDEMRSAQWDGSVPTVPSQMDVDDAAKKVAASLDAMLTQVEPGMNIAKKYRRMRVDSER